MEVQMLIDESAPTASGRWGGIGRMGISEHAVVVGAFHWDDLEYVPVLVRRGAFGSRGGRGPSPPSPDGWG